MFQCGGLSLYCFKKNGLRKVTSWRHLLTNVSKWINQKYTSLRLYSIVTIEGQGWPFHTKSWRGQKWHTEGCPSGEMPCPHHRPPAESVHRLAPWWASLPGDCFPYFVPKSAKQIQFLWLNANFQERGNFWFYTIWWLLLTKIAHFATWNTCFKMFILLKFFKIIFLFPD